MYANPASHSARTILAALALTAAASTVSAQTVTASHAGDGFMSSTIGLQLDFAPNTMAGQVFTATASGTLHTVSVRAGAREGAPDLTISFFSLGSNDLPETLLATRSLPWNAFAPQSYTAFDFDLAQINIVAGTRYAFAVSTATTHPEPYIGWYGLVGDSAASYSGGNGIGNYNNNQGWFNNGYDYNFIVTVPTPSTAAITGGLALAALRRRRR